MLRQFSLREKRRSLLWTFALVLLLVTLGCRTNSPAGGAIAQTDSAQFLSIDQFYSVFGTKYLQAAAFISVDAERYAFSSYGGKTAKTYNYIFLNPDDLTSQWLLPHSNYFFVQAQELPLRKTEREEDKTKPQPPQPPTKMLIYTLVKANTNDNKILDGQDRKTIAVSDVSGSGYSEIIQDVDYVIHRQMYSPDEFLITYHSSGKNIAARINLTTRQITLTKELTPIPKSQQPMS